MDEVDAQKVCRTCLKYPLEEITHFNLLDYCTSQKTYGQLLEEYAQFEFDSEQEGNLPQGICSACCRQLNKVHTFITQAKNCNLQLMNMLLENNQLDCLREEAIDIPIKVDDEDAFKIKKEHTITNSSDDDEDGNISFNKSDDELNVDFIFTENGESHDYDSNKVETETIISGTEDTNHGSSPKHQSMEFALTSKLLNTSATITCPICVKLFKRRIYLLRHLNKIHKITNAAGFLKKHLGQHKKSTLNKIINCAHCEYTAKSYPALTYHNRTRHATDDDKYKCKYCSFANLKRWALVGHIKNEHKLEFKTLKKNVEKNQQLLSATTNDCVSPDVNDVPNFNEISLDDSSDDEGFIRHMISEDRRVQKSKYVDGEPFLSLARKCDVCGKVYKNFQSLYAHKRFVHITEDMYSACLHCGKKYKRSQDLKNHILQMHTNSNSTSSTVLIPDVQGKRFMCTECPYATTTTTHLKIHVRRHHTGEKPYVCEICGNSFLTLYCLKKHSYLHTGEKPHKCPYCPKTFRVTAKLTKHKRIHTGERPYKCTECGKGFTQDYNLSVHKRTHNKDLKKSQSSST